ncbi:hypothetical protein AVEN_109018-1 [Araneus ventricosus]|uniref:BTB domain-containing protein n=1 Tax=Araneus ventricosus TaxID=182803 RepID=A0A4Y2HNA1_ARAVE|nr:hypothetical protein AVEN_109018-1 [Araneus ventricosus]
MEYERKGVTLDWQIENVKNIRLQAMELYSPVISVDVMDGTKWKLVVHKIFSSYIWFSIRRETEDNGFFSDLQRHNLRPFQEHLRNWCACVAPSANSPRTFRNGQVPSPDTLMIRCKIWRQQESISKSGHFYARTRMRTESFIFVGKVDNFSAFSVTDRKTLKIVSSSTGEGLMKVNVVLSKTYQVPQIELIPVENPTGSGASDFQGGHSLRHEVTDNYRSIAAILSALSPVFEAMFRSNMKEVIEKCVHLDDVDAETVKHMLMFLYSDTLEDLEWKDAMKLYVAADKYQILSLR